MTLFLLHRFMYFGFSRSKKPLLDEQFWVPFYFIKSFVEKRNCGIDRLKSTSPAIYISQIQKKGFSKYWFPNAFF